jgi:hypothetical protein
MINRVLTLVSGVLLASTAFAADGLNVKTGQWETTYTTKVSGQVIPNEMLDKMTPEQRAKLEQAMAARSGSQPKAHVSKNCVTKEDLAKGAFDPPDSSCKSTVIERSSTHEEVSVECTRNGVTQKGHMTVDAISNERIKGKMEMLAGEGKVLAEFDGKWLSASCPDATK